MNINWVGFYTLLRRELGRTKRILGQTLISPLVTSTLYVFVFGYVVGSRISTIEGLKYISFVFPGIFGMNLIMSVFSATSFAMFMLKFQKTIEDLLTLPVSYTEIVLSLVFSGIIRALLIAAALVLVAVVFGIAAVPHPLILIWYVLLVSVFFGLLGLVVGVWGDNNFERLGLATNFVLTPLTFLGGAFYSSSMLPERWRFIIDWNPIFYANDGIRYALVGYHEASLWFGTGVLLTLSLATLALCVWIFRTGWKLRA